MTTELKPYPEYKPISLLWLDKIPEHWQLIKTKHLFRERSEKGYPDEPLLAATQTKGVVRKEQYENRTVLALKDLQFLKLVKVGDFVISLRSFQGGIEITHEQGIISPAYTVLYPKKSVNPQFFAKLFKSKPYIENLTLYVTGIRQGQNIDYERLSRSYLPVPSVEEQTKITQFITHFDSRITRLIRLKRKQIALLNEQKQAIIQQAVTRGLDTDVRLKPSGVEWLGDIPEHWNLRRLKTIAKIRYGLGQPPRELESGLPLLRATNIDSGRITTRDLIMVDPADVPKTRNAFLSKNEIIVVRSGAYTADSAIIPGEYDGAVSGYDMVVTVTKAYPQFIAMALLSAYVRDDQLITSSMRSAQPHLNTSELGNSIILFPPFEEQLTITEYIKDIFTSIDKAIDHAKDTIQTLQEYRTRLIADVVTGKLDVRGVELPEMELSEQEETFDEAGDLPEDELEVEIDGEDGYE